MKNNIRTFTKSNLPNGWMGNMAGFHNGKALTITYEDKLWKTSENLFQALRFNDAGIQGLIRRENGFNGKKVTKRFTKDMSITPLMRQDVLNMIFTVRLKLDQHQELIDLLLDTKEDIIIEDVSSRMGGTGLFWGSALVGNNWIGHNCLGKIYMYLRDDFRCTMSDYGDDDLEFIEKFFENIVHNTFLYKVDCIKPLDGFYELCSYKVYDETKDHIFIKNIYGEIETIEKLIFNKYFKK